MLNQNYFISDAALPNLFHNVQGPPLGGDDNYLHWGILQLVPEPDQLASSWYKGAGFVRV